MPALSKNLEDLLKHMTPADAATQRKIWEDSPAIAASVDKFFVPQAEFNRQLNLKDEEILKEKKKADAWDDWGKKNKPKHEQLLTEHEKLQQSYAELQRQAKLAAEGTEGIVDPGDLEKKVLERLAGKTVTQEQLQKVMQEETQKMLGEVKTMLDGTRKDFLEKTFPQVTQFQADLFEVMQDHQAEFGKKLDRAEFGKFMQEQQITDPKKAYERFTEPAKRAKEISDQVEQGVKDRMSKLNMPGVSDSSGASELGPLQLKISGQTPTFPEASELGDLSASALAAKEMRTEGHF